MKKYIIKANKNGHGFKIGQVVTIVPSHSGLYQATAVRGKTPNANHVSSLEIEAAPTSENKKIFVVTIVFMIACALLDFAGAFFA